ncbi:hypothetical protein, partial [Accumulibacter sp.]|uniref:hypothetical protein n=1 Tax=Accumulibacter sp. TaxID=2053492 RepID=UPI0025F4E7F3
TPASQAPPARIARPGADGQRRSAATVRWSARHVAHRLGNIRVKRAFTPTESDPPEVVLDEPHEVTRSVRVAAQLHLDQPGFFVAHAGADSLIRSTPYADRRATDGFSRYSSGGKRSTSPTPADGAR